MRDHWQDRLFDRSGRNGSLVLPAATTAAVVAATAVLWCTVVVSSDHGKNDGETGGSWMHTITRPITALYSRIYVAALQLRSDNDDSDSPDANTVVTDLVYYPVKSLQRVPVQEATIGARGLQHDRGYMIVVPTGASGNKPTHRFVSQRRYPSLARVQATMMPGDGTTTTTTTSSSSSSHEKHSLLRLHNATTNTSCTVALVPPADAPLYKARVWSQTVHVQDMGDAAAEWLQQSVVANDPEFDPETDDPVPVRLVRQLPSDGRRANGSVVPFVARTLLGQTPRVSLADGFPLYVLFFLSFFLIHGCGCSRVKSNYFLCAVFFPM